MKKIQGHMLIGPAIVKGHKKAIRAPKPSNQ